MQALRPGGPAAAAGIHTGDIIVGLGNTKITGVNALVAATAAHKPGDRVPVTVTRGGKRLSLTLTLAKEPASNTAG